MSLRALPKPTYTPKLNRSATAPCFPAPSSFLVSDTTISHLTLSPRHPASCPSWPIRNLRLGLQAGRHRHRRLETERAVPRKSRISVQKLTAGDDQGPDAKVLRLHQRRRCGRQHPLGAAVPYRLVREESRRIDTQRRWRRQRFCFGQRHVVVVWCRSNDCQRGRRCCIFH